MDIFEFVMFLSSVSEPLCFFKKLWEFGLQLCNFFCNDFLAPSTRACSSLLCVFKSSRTLLVIKLCKDSFCIADVVVFLTFFFFHYSNPPHGQGNVLPENKDGHYLKIFGKKLYKLVKISFMAFGLKDTRRMDIVRDVRAWELNKWDNTLKFVRLNILQRNNQNGLVRRNFHTPR